MKNLLQKRGIEVTRSLAQDIKEKRCLVSSESYCAEENREFKYKLPDGKEISIINEHIVAPECKSARKIST